MADSTDTDLAAARAGILIDLRQTGETFRFEGGTVTKMTLGVSDAFVDATESDAEYWAVMAGAVADAVEAAEESEPGGRLYATDPLPELGNRPLWLQDNGDGFTLMFPEDY